jgi:hypothetical protein
MSEQRGDAGAEALAHDADAAVPVGARAGHDHQGDHDDHGDDEHAGVMLGPVDWPAWTAGIVGVALGLAVAICLVFSVGGIG